MQLFGHSSAESSPRHRRLVMRRFLSPLAATAVALGLVATSVVAGLTIAPTTSASADLGQPAAITLQKTVDDVHAITDGKPGDEFTYSIVVGCDDNECVNAKMTDALPAEFALFTLQSLTYTNTADRPSTTTLTGCAVGSAIGENCAIDATFTKKLGNGGTDPVGIKDGDTYRVEAVLKVPTNLSPSWPSNGDVVTNTAKATADNSAPATDSADVTVTIPTTVDVTAGKTWSPSSQSFNPGASSTVTVTGASAANVPASELSIQDPQVAVDGASTLDTTNPFRYVNFSALGASTLPQGADQVEVDAYYYDGTKWNWVSGAAAAAAALPATVTDLTKVGGIRFVYTSTTGTKIVGGGTAASQAFTVKQRSTDRIGGDGLTGGFSAANKTDVTLTVPSHAPVDKQATATLTVGALDVKVTATKTITPAEIPAGEPFTTALTAKNTSIGTLDTLTITEPKSGTFFGPKMMFDEFLGADWAWPNGADDATFTWQYSDGSHSADIDLHEGDLPPPTPAQSSGTYVSGFTVVYSGAIASGATAGITFTTQTDPDLVPTTVPVTPSQLFSNTVSVDGTNVAGTASKDATDTVRVYYPDIKLTLDKSISPSVATPGGTVVAKLKATTSATAIMVDPTTIVVQDGWDGTGATDFWDAFRATSIAFTDIPDGSKLTVEYNTGTVATPDWHTLASDVPSTSAPYSAALPSPATIIGLRFTYTDPSGFGQGTIVQPNVVFTASDTLRSNGAATSVAAADPVATVYHNLASAKGTGHAGSVPVTSDLVTDPATAGVITYTGAGGIGDLLASKRWVDADGTTDLTHLNSQSGATAGTRLTWGVTTPGYQSVTISDAEPGSETTPEDTVFQAFDLASVGAVSFTSDPLLKWDTVDTVELYYSGAWHTVAAPGGSWMNGTGFKGYTLSSTERATTTGVRVTVIENTAARSASSDPTAPAPSSGVASSASGRVLPLFWNLRNALRIPGATNWVTDDVTYNGGLANVDNVMAVTAKPISGGSVGPRTASDTVNLIDSVPGVNTSKSASVSSVVVPYPGDVDPAAYPTVDFTIDAWNTSSTRASYIRSADVVPCSSASDCLSAASDHGSDIFTGRTYDASSTFERFTLTGVSFTVPSTVPVDKNASTVTLWLRDAAGALTVQNTTMDGVAAMSASALANVVGISVVYQSTDPATTGGLLPKGDHITMKLATRLRDTLRSDPSTPLVGSVTVTNTTYAQGFDPVTAPTDKPYATQQASVDLVDGKLDVTATKDISPNTILEAAPTTPVSVKLTATDGTSTVAAETATITDETVGFWSKFQLTGLGTVTRPAGAAHVRVDVKVAGSWVHGVAAATAALPASVTDLTTVEGIRFVYDNDPTKLFSSTVPSAGWNAEANFGVVLRAGATFPDSVDNTVETEATHTGLPDAGDHADDTITLGSGSFALDVHKDLATHILEPGVAVPWTLTFTNTGSGFLDITKVVDTLPAKLTWDGSAPTYATSAGGTLATTGIDVTQPTADTITFVWPSGARMQPGESFVITLNIALEPGLTTAERATNQFVVTTDQSPLTCTNSSGNAQGLLTGLDLDQCGTTNYAQPQSGALLFTQKGVKGEVDGTLVDGATNINDPSLPCTPDAGGFFRTTCAADTVIGATDTWKIVSTNTGTVDYKKLTIVDPLPVPGDRLLATGATRGSGYRPVFDPTSLTITPSVAGATANWEVTTAAAPCVSAGATTWPSDPTCSTHPSSASWIDSAAFTGDWADVTAVRIVIDFTSVPTDHVLKPGGTVTVLYNTKNTPGATADAVKTIVPAGAQFAWNQAGVTAALSTGGVISRAPSRTGVSIQTGPLEIAKALAGNATFLAPSTVDFDVACTAAGTPLDMGTYSTVTVTPGSSAIVPDIPLGAECAVQEHGPVGSYGETSRTAAKTVHILASASGAGVTPSAQSVTFTNTYVAAPAITLAKDGALAPGSKNAAGDTVDYTFAVVNTGNVTLTDVHITDVLPGVSAVTFAPGFSGTLAPGQSTTATATYTLTQADVDAGKVDNTATVVGTPPVGPKVDDTDPATVTVTPDPSVVLQKTSAFAPGGSLKKGDGVIYTFAASNTGNVTLTELQIVDEMPGLSAPVFSAWPSTPGKLLPGETVTTTATYALTQADVDAGSLTNHAIVVATPPSGPTITGGSTSTISISPKPAITLVKTGTFAPGSTGVVGDTVNYSFVATNTGNVTLTRLAISDAKPGLSAISYGAWPQTTGLLGPGESVTATATYTLTAADVLSGTVTNSATVSAVGLVNAVPTKVSAASGVKITVPTGLAATGLTLMPPVLAMTVLILLGVGLILVARRRRHRLVG